MMNTRIAILPSTAPANGSRNLLAMPSVKRGDQRAPEIADAAEHHDQEAVDDVALPEIGADVVDLRQRDAGDAGDAGAEPEGERIDARGADAHRGRHRAVLRHGAHLEAEPREAQQRRAARRTPPA